MDLGPPHGPAGGIAVVDRVAAALFNDVVGLGHRTAAKLKLHVGGDTVLRRKSAIGNVEAVLVGVDEARRNHETFHVYDFFAREFIGGYRSNLAILDAHIHNCIKRGLRVHNPSTFQHNVIVLCVDCKRSDQR